MYYVARSQNKTLTLAREIAQATPSRGWVHYYLQGFGRAAAGAKRLPSADAPLLRIARATARLEGYSWRLRDRSFRAKFISKLSLFSGYGAKPCMAIARVLFI